MRRRRRRGRSRHREPRARRRARLVPRRRRRGCASSRFRPRASGSRSPRSPPFLETEAKLERIGVPGGAEADATHIYVAKLRLPRAGKYWLLAEPEGGAKKVQALGNVVVVKEDAPPDVGDPAVASETPTLASTGRTLSALTTRTPPDETLLRYSVADSLAANVPFVVTFATPKFCSSRTCGPGRRRRRGGVAALRGRRDPLHPRRGVRGQRPGEGLQPLDAGVEAADRALDVPRRRDGKIVGAVRRDGLGERARAGRPREARPADPR